MGFMVDQAFGEGAPIGFAADRVGVTVRTLRHWDEIGLASPSSHTPAGYRLYVPADLDRLHRVVAYRETGLGLDMIRRILDDDALKIGDTLREQRVSIASRIQDLQHLDERLERMANAHEHGILMSEKEQTEVFGETWDSGRSGMARSAWGRSPQWAQFAERSATRTRDQWQALSDEMSTLQRDLGDAMSRGVTPGNADADQLVDRHRDVFSNFFPLTRQMQVCLGRMYDSDPRFAAHYNSIRDGLATWFRQLIDESARGDGLDPDTATWQ